ncbi:MAG: hypothetical protein U1E87_03220 [Alphaproteobacteria bacterium]
MRRTLLALLASAALTSALPVDAIAAAAPDNGSYRQRQDGDWVRGRRGRGCDKGAYGEVQSELQRLYQRVRQGERDRSYTRDSARNFYRAIQLDQQYLDQYNRDRCIDRGEVNDLRYRIDALRQQMEQYDRRPGRRRW